MSRLKKLGMLNREGMKAVNGGRVDDAMFQLIQADRIARDMESPLHEAKVRNNIGLIHQVSGKFDEAFACFRLAEKSAIKGAGKGNMLHKIIARNLTRLEQVAGAEAA